MVVHSFYIFDRHAACIYCRSWARDAIHNEITETPADSSQDDVNEKARYMRDRLSSADDAKLVFGTVFSLRNMVRKLSGNFISYRTGQYKLHYYETPTSLKFVMLTDIQTVNLRVVLQQIYINLYVEYVVKNPLSRMPSSYSLTESFRVWLLNIEAAPDHNSTMEIGTELFDMGLERFINTGM